MKHTGEPIYKSINKSVHWWGVGCVTWNPHTSFLVPQAVFKTSVLIQLAHFTTRSYLELIQVLQPGSDKNRTRTWISHSQLSIPYAPKLKESWKKLHSASSFPGLRICHVWERIYSSLNLLPLFSGSL